MTFRSDYIDRDKVFKLFRLGLECQIVALRTGYSKAWISKLKGEFNEICRHEVKGKTGSGEDKGSNRDSVLRCGEEM